MILKDDFRIKIIYENSSQKCKIELNSMFSRNHPACPSIPHIIAMGYRTMVESDPRLNGLQEKLIRAKVPLPLAILREDGVLVQDPDVTALGLGDRD